MELKEKVELMSAYEDERRLYSGISKGEFDRIADEISKKHEKLTRETAIDIIERSIWIREQKFVKSIQHALGPDLPLEKNCDLDDAVTSLISQYLGGLKCHSV